MPVDILIFALIAGYLFFRLRDSLGERHGEERERPNPLAKPAEDDEEALRETREAEAQEILDVAGRKPEPSPFGEVVDAKLVQISLADRGFDPKAFLDGAKQAFPMIVEAFARGDRPALRGLLSAKTYEAFEGVIAAREEKEEFLVTDIHAVRQAEITDARMDDSWAYVTVRFVADETVVCRDKDDKILYGHPDHVAEKIDIWTFGRDVKSSDPVWYLFETREGASADA